MAQPASTPPSSGTESNRGIVAELVNFAGSFGRHVQALVTLAGFESKEAAAVYLRVLAVAVVGLIALVFGYVFTVIFVAFLVATIFQISWIWILLGLAVLHFAAVAGCAFFVKKHVSKPVFTATSAELKKDFDALARFKPSQP